MPAIALFDMDGTLFDYDGQMQKDLVNLMSPEETITEEMLREGDMWALAKDHPYLERRMDLIKKVPGWWKNLPKFQLGWDVLKYAQEIGFCCHILTKGPRKKSFAWAEKVECIDLHLGEDFPIDIVGKDKDNRYGRVLVDDYPTYMEGWLANRKRGLGIMPRQKVNIGFEHPNVVVYDGTNIKEVVRALKAAYLREPKQHWRDVLDQVEF